MEGRSIGYSSNSSKSNDTDRNNSSAKIELEISFTPIRTEAETYEDLEEWISKFLKQKGNDIICRVDDSFIKDSFNLEGLKKQVPNFVNAVYHVLNMKPPEHISGEKMEDSPLSLSQSCVMVYALIHQRFAQTAEGFKQVLTKHEKGVFGHCPRVLCEKQKLLPSGQSSDYGVSLLHMYCPLCKDIYAPTKKRHSKIDGAFFGPNFPNLVMMNFPKYFSCCREKIMFEPNLYGFKLHETSPSHPQKMEYDIKEQKTKLCPKVTAKFAGTVQSKIVRGFLVKK